MPYEDGRKLSLLARDVQDLAVISSMLQDAIVPVVDMVYLEREQSFILALNRFCWETPTDEAADKRVNAGLRFDRVQRVQFRKIDREHRERFAVLLSVAYDSGVVTMQFSGDGAVRLEVSELLCALSDFDEAWPTIWRPEHQTP